MSPGPATSLLVFGLLIGAIAACGETRHLATCPSVDALGAPPELYVELDFDAGDRTWVDPAFQHYTWERCGTYTLISTGVIFPTGGTGALYEDTTLIVGSVNVPRRGADRYKTCGSFPNEARQCSPWCLWWDFAVSTEFAELPPGDPGWCEDSPWRDFVYEP